MAEDLEKLKIKIEADLKDFKSSMKDSSSSVKEFTSVIKDAGKSTSGINSGFSGVTKTLSDVSSKMKSLGATLTKSLTEPIMDLGKDLKKLGDDFNKAYITIRRGTGATGEELNGLKNDFKSVFSSSASTMTEVSQAVTQLNQRTNMAGKPLQDMAKQVLALSKIVGEDLEGVISSSTRLFGDWGISSEQSSKKLDYIFKVSQATGMSVTTLNEKMVKFGAPLRQMGFEFETSAALMGKWEKEGVNAELVLASLRIALGKMAKAGVTDTNKALTSLVKKIKEAGSTGAANALAIQTFGARAGPDMAAAIREGRFEIDAFLKSLKDSPETIRGLSAETATISGKIQKLKNQITVAMEPLATTLLKVLENVNPYIEMVITKISELAKWFEGLGPGVQMSILAIGGIIAAIGPLVTVIGIVAGAIVNIITLFTSFGATLTGITAGTGALGAIFTALSGPIGWVIAAIVALSSAFVVLYNTNESFRNKVGEVWVSIQNIIKPIIDDIVNFAVVTFGKLKGIVENTFNQIAPVVLSAFNAISGFINDNMGTIQAIFSVAWQIVMKIALNAWETIKGIINAGMMAIGGIFNIFGGLITGNWQQAWNGLLSVLSAPFALIGTTLKGLLGTILALFNTNFAQLGQFLSGIWTNIVTGISNFVSSAIQSIGSFVVSVIQFFVNLQTNIQNTLIGLFVGAVAAVTNGITAVQNAIVSGWNAIITFFSELPGRISYFLIDFFTVQIPYRISYAVGLISKLIYEGINAIVGFFAELPSRVVNATNSLISICSTIGQNIINSIVSFVVGLPSKFTELFNKSVITIAAFTIAAKNYALEAGKNIINAIISFTISLPGKLAKIFMDAVTVVVSLRNQFVAKGIEIGQGILNAIINFLKPLPGQIMGIFNSVQSKIAEFGTIAVAKAMKIGTNISDGIKNGLNYIITEVPKIGLNIVMGLWNGIQEKLGWLKNQITTFCTNVVQGFKDGWEIKSPSKLMIEIGENITKGIAIGIANNADMVTDQVDNITNSVDAQVKEFEKAIKGINDLRDSDDKALKELQYQSRLTEKYDELSEKETSLGKAKDKDEYIRIEKDIANTKKEINEMVADRERELLEDSRKTQEQVYNDQIESIKKVGEEHKKMFEQARESSEKLKDSVELIKNGYNDLGDSIKKALQNKYKAEKEAIDKYIDAVKNENEEVLALVDLQYLEKVKKIKAANSFEISLFKDKIKQLNELQKNENSQRAFEERTKTMKEKKAALDKINEELSKNPYDRESRLANTDFQDQLYVKQQDKNYEIADKEKDYQRKLAAKKAELSLHQIDVRWQGHSTNDDEQKAIDDINKEIEEMTLQHKYDLEDIDTAYNRDVEKMTRDHNKEMANLANNFQIETVKNQTKLNEDKKSLLTDIKDIETKTEREGIERQKSTEIEAYNNRISTIESEQPKVLEKLKQAKLDELEINSKKYEEKLKDDNLFQETAKILTDKNNTEIINILRSYYPNWLDAGKTFGDKLVEGIDSKKQTVIGKVNEMLSIINTTDSQVQSQIASLNNIIIQAKKDWTIANTSGDTEGMNNASYIAELARAASGYNVKILKATDKIPGFANGVRNFMGGAAIVGEKGPELVNLPRGSSVTPNNQLGQNVTINNSFHLSGVTIRNESDIKSIARELYNLQESSNRGKGVILR